MASRPYNWARFHLLDLANRAIAAPEEWDAERLARVASWLVPPSAEQPVLEAVADFAAALAEYDDYNEGRIRPQDVEPGLSGLHAETYAADIVEERLDDAIAQLAGAVSRDEWRAAA